MSSISSPNLKNLLQNIVMIKPIKHKLQNELRFGKLQKVKQNIPNILFSDN